MNWITKLAVAFMAVAMVFSFFSCSKKDEPNGIFQRKGEKRLKSVKIDGEDSERVISFFYKNDFLYKINEDVNDTDNHKKSNFYIFNKISNDITVNTGTVYKLSDGLITRIQLDDEEDDINVNLSYNSDRCVENVWRGSDEVSSGEQYIWEDNKLLKYGDFSYLYEYIEIKYGDGYCKGYNPIFSDLNFSGKDYKLLALVYPELLGCYSNKLPSKLIYYYEGSSSRRETYESKINYTFYNDGHIKTITITRDGFKIITYTFVWE